MDDIDDLPDTEIDGIRMEPPEVFNSRPQPAKQNVTLAEGNTGALGQRKITQSIKPPTPGKVGKLLEQLEKAISRDDLILAVKHMRAFVEEEDRKTAAAHNKQIAQLTAIIKDLTEEVKSLRTAQSQQVRVQHKSLADVQAAGLRVGSLEKSLEGHIKTLRQELLDTSAAQAKATERWLNKRIEGLSGLQGDRLESLHKMFEMGVGAAEERFKSLLMALPTPQVHFAVPEGAIKMEQLPAQVTVNVPPQAAPVVNSESKIIVPHEAFKFYVEQPAPQVIVPKKALQVHVTQASAPPVAIGEKAFQPQVTINVPEQPAPIVNVEQSRVPVKKHIIYDEHSRPSTITEVPIDAREDTE